MLQNVPKKAPYYLFKWADNVRQEEREEEVVGERGATQAEGEAILHAAVASLFSVLTDARAQPLDEWPCAE